MRINIVYDHCPENPRDWENLGTMVCFHRRYNNLGDRNDFRSPEELMAYIEANEGPGFVWLPIYMYDHSGITISTRPFFCPWDSGQIGVIFAFTPDGMTDEQVKEALETEVEVYDKYLRGEVYGYEIVDEDGEIFSSCYGFYSEEEAIEAAKEEIHHVEA